MAEAVYYEGPPPIGLREAWQPPKSLWIGGHGDGVKQFSPCRHNMTWITTTADHTHVVGGWFWSNIKNHCEKAADEILIPHTNLGLSQFSSLLFMRREGDAGSKSIPGRGKQPRRVLNYIRIKDSPIRMNCRGGFSTCSGRLVNGTGIIRKKWATEERMK